MPDAVGGSTAKPPSCQSKPTVPKLAAPTGVLPAMSVDLELARIDVTQREIGVTSCVDRGDARELPIQPNRA